MHGRRVIQSYLIQHYTLRRCNHEPPPPYRTKTPQGIFNGDRRGWNTWLRGDQGSRLNQRFWGRGVKNEGNGRTSPKTNLLMIEESVGDGFSELFSLNMLSIC